MAFLLEMQVPISKRLKKLYHESNATSYIKGYRYALWFFTDSLRY